jgi:hypothetical protein
VILGLFLVPKEETFSILTSMYTTWTSFIKVFSAVISVNICIGGAPVAQLVETLRCKPEGHGFVSQWCHWNLSLA